jgi:pimeloyl-ACP methyl ester carboxylesterase
MSLSTNRNVFFLPGAGGDADFWRPVGDLLPSTWSKHYFNWPGLGHQKPHVDITGFDDLVRRVEQSLDEQPTDLVAQSMGGVIALRVALRNPNHVRRLVLVATSGGVDVAGLGGLDWRPVYRQEFPQAAAWILDPQPDLSPELGSVTQPALLLWGDADPLSPIAVGERLLQLLPAATLRIVAAGDHGLARERAAEVATLILKHLE